MVNNIFYAAIGTLLAFLAGLGVGGGSLLMLWLTLVLNISHETAASINLLFFIPSATVTTLFRKRQGTIHTKQLLPAIIASAISAIIGNYFKIYMHLSVLKKAFGVMLVITGIRELIYRPRKAK